MNIAIAEQPIIIEAKTSGSYRKKSISYHVIESSHGLCLGKTEIISAQIQACERLMDDTRDEIDNNVIETEIAELKLTLDLLP